MSTSFDLPRPSAPHDISISHELTPPHEGARSLLVLSIAAVFCVLLFLALSAIGPNAAGASEPALEAEVGTAIVCDTGTGIVTTTESGGLIDPALCEVRGAAPTDATDVTVAVPASDMTEIASADIGAANAFSFGWRPGFGALLVGSSIATRLLGRLLWRRRNMRWSAG